MDVNCGWLIEIMEGHAPLALAMEYDNAGLILGSAESPLNKVLVALDLTDAVADEAVANSVSMVLTHHPMIFKAVKRITDADSLGRRIMKLLRHDIAVYAAHTNLDIAKGGTNDVLADLLGLGERTALEAADENGNGLGRVGVLPAECTLSELARVLKEKLCLPVVGVTGDVTRSVRKVGLCTGSGSAPKYIETAHRHGCDVYITGDVTYHNAQAAAELGIALIDATHYGTEVIIVKALKRLLDEQAARAGIALEVIESAVNARTLEYV